MGGFWLGCDHLFSAGQPAPSCAKLKDHASRGKGGVLGPVRSTADMAKGRCARAGSWFALD
jgi:hypothetical protein